MVVFGWKVTLDEMEIGPTDTTDTHMDPNLPWRREWDRLLDSAKWCGIDGSGVSTTHAGIVSILTGSSSIVDHLCSTL